MASYQELLELVQSKDPLQLQLASQLPSEDEDWNQLLSEHPQLAFNLAQNSNLPLALFDQLAHSPNPRVRLMVARHGKLSYDSLERLADDPEPAVRLLLAKRADLDPQTHALLLQDPDAGVRLAAQRYQPQPLAQASGW